MQKNIEIISDSWKKWVILKRICTAFYAKPSFNTTESLWDVVKKGVSRTYFIEVLTALVADNLVVIEKTGDVKKVSIKDKKALSDITDIIRNSKFFDEISDFLETTNKFYRF